MLGLTIWQPWASLIVGSPPTEDCPGAPPQKSIENRDERPWRSAIGQRIAVHAGKHMGEDTLDTYHDIFKSQVYGPVTAPYRTPALFPRGVVVGVATIDRVVGPLQPSIFYDSRLDSGPVDRIASWGLAADDLRWFTGTFGWVLRDRQYIATPVPCRGLPGLFPLPDDVERAVMAQIASVRKECRTP